LSVSCRRSSVFPLFFHLSVGPSRSTCRPQPVPPPAPSGLDSTLRRRSAIPSWLHVSPPLCNRCPPRGVFQVWLRFFFCRPPRSGGILLKPVAHLPFFPHGPGEPRRIFFFISRQLLRPRSSLQHLSSTSFSRRHLFLHPPRAGTIPRPFNPVPPHMFRPTFNGPRVDPSPRGQDTCSPTCPVNAVHSGFRTLLKPKLLFSSLRDQSRVADRLPTSFPFLCRGAPRLRPTVAPSRRSAMRFLRPPLPSLPPFFFDVPPAFPGPPSSPAWRT